MNSATALTWEKLTGLVANEIDRIQGPTNSYTSIRLFNQKADQVKVTLYRDNHAWCPYCQKVWLWLELKQIPYRIKKVTMRCYGEKEIWYLKKVRSGMLPAIEIEQELITESDQILFSLEQRFGPLGSSLNNGHIIKLRELERELFRAWCIWLCYPARSNNEETERKTHFQEIATKLEHQLQVSNGYFLDLTTINNTIASPGVGDVIFIPFIERMI